MFGESCDCVAHRNAGIEAMANLLFCVVLVRGRLSVDLQVSALRPLILSVHERVQRTVSDTTSDGGLGLPALSTAMT